MYFGFAETNLDVFTDVSVNGTCNQTSASGTTTSYTANSCTLIPWGKQVGGRPAAGWYKAPCGEQPTDDEDGGGGGGNDDGGNGSDAASNVSPSVLTIISLWALSTVIGIVHLA